MELAHVPLVRKSGPNKLNPLATRSFDLPAGDDIGPEIDGLGKLAEEARICGEINFVGTTLALATFVS